MRFTDVRVVAAPADHVWQALHDPEVLRAAIPGCRELRSVGGGHHEATLTVRIGRLADTYRGTFGIEDRQAGTELGVVVAARGRCGHLELDLTVCLQEASTPSVTALAYDARASVGGLVARLGRAPLTVAGGHLTGCFFRDLDRVMAQRGGRATVEPLIATAS